MEEIFGAVGVEQKPRSDDDVVDRLSHRYTTVILVIFAVVVSTTQYVGQPINCWAPTHFTGNQEDYTNSFCWVRNTYYLDFGEYIPKEDEDRMIIPYYQWVPMILLVQALCFYMPCLFWRALNPRSGMDAHHLVEAGQTFLDSQRVAERDKKLRDMTLLMDRYLNGQNTEKPGLTVSLKNAISRTCCRTCGRRKGNYLVSIYLLTKFIFITNAIAQLFLLNVFLGTDFHFYGIHVLRALVQGEDWTASPRFPRVTMCDLKVRRLGNVHRYTVQCVLPINLFNEKIYLFIWFWLVLVATLSCFSFLAWALRTSTAQDQHRYIKKHLGKQLSRDDKMACVRFVRDYLRPDGVFLLRLLGHNTNEITVTDFVRSLWEKYRARPRSGNYNGME